MTKIKPLFDRVLVKRVEKEEKTPGGILIPETAQENKTQTGSVVSFGEGKDLPDGKIRPMKIKTGDKIIFGKYAGTEFKVDGQEYLILKEEEILGLIE